MAQAAATKAIKMITSALRASARRNPRSAVTSPPLTTCAATVTASAATAANTSRFNRSQTARDRTARQSRPASSGRRGRRRRVMALTLSLLASNDLSGLAQQILQGHGQPHAENQQPAQEQSHGGHAIPRAATSLSFRSWLTEQDARELLQEAAKARDQSHQH